MEKKGIFQRWDREREVMPWQTTEVTVLGSQAMKCGCHPQAPLQRAQGGACEVLSYRKIRHELMLTVHLGEKSSWTWSLATSRSRCRTCRGRTPCAGCGPGTWCAARVLPRSRPAGPAGCVPATGHSPHRSCEQNKTHAACHTHLPKDVFSVCVSPLRCPHRVICSVQETQGYIYRSFLPAYFYFMQAELCVTIKHLPLRLLSWLHLLCLPSVCISLNSAQFLSLSAWTHSSQMSSPSSAAFPMPSPWPPCLYKFNLPNLTPSLRVATGTKEALTWHCPPAKPCPHPNFWNPARLVKTLQSYKLDAQYLFSAIVHISTIQDTHSVNVKQLACKMEDCFNFFF